MSYKPGGRRWPGGITAPQYVGSPGPSPVTFSTFTGTPVSNINAPAGIVAGNLLLAVITNAGGGASTITLAGFTQIGYAGANWTCAVLVKTATGSEPASYAWTSTFGGSSSAVIGQYQASGADGTPAVVYNSASSVATAPSVTPTAPNDRLVVVYACQNGTAYTTPSSPAGLVQEAGSFGNPVMTLYDAPYPGLAPTGPINSGLNQSTVGTAASILLKP